MADVNTRISLEGHNRAPRIVAIIGSSKFKDQHLGVAQKLTLQGKIVLLAGFWHHIDKVPITDEKKKQLDELMFAKIDWAHEVYVVNPHGYLGKSTQRGIERAMRLNKTVTYLETPT